MHMRAHGLMPWFLPFVLLQWRDEHGLEVFTQEFATRLILFKNKQ
jgi:hypothetical protein